MLFFGVGAGIGRSPTTTAGEDSVDASERSLAGGLMYMLWLAGGAIGLAITTAIFTAFARDAFITGLRGAMIFLAVLAGAGAVLSVLFVARRPRTAPGGGRGVSAEEP